MTFSIHDPLDLRNARDKPNADIAIWLGRNERYFFPWEEVLSLELHKRNCPRYRLFWKLDSKRKAHSFDTLFVSSVEEETKSREVLRHIVQDSEDIAQCGLYQEPTNTVEEEVMRQRISASSSLYTFWMLFEGRQCNQINEADVTFYIDDCFSIEENPYTWQDNFPAEDWQLKHHHFRPEIRHFYEGAGALLAKITGEYAYV